MGNLVAGKATAEVAAGDARADGGGALPSDGAGGPRARSAIPTIHRWLDLDRRDRRWALAVGVALLLAPLAALVHYIPDWAPAGDPALMGLRSLDVGTAATPLIGQPSASGAYTEGVRNVHHPGPLHFYLMAVPVRMLGGAFGMLLVSVLITGTCLAASAWAVFRQLGRRAGVVAAGALAMVAFTTGASSLVDPTSSNISGYPLLASTVLLWCVACGDLRLLPAAAGAVSFTAQQHLAVVPATLVLSVGAVALLAVTGWRRGWWHDRARRRDLARSSAWAGAVALVLWAPVLIQQAFGTEGNLGQMLWFARHGNSDTVGYTSALWQLTHALGLPPLLGRTSVTGQWLLSRPSPFGWVSAAAVVVAVVALGRHWWVRDPRRAALCAMAGVVAVAGLVNGASVPVGTEQYRLPFYHWAFVLALFVAVIVGLAVTDVVRARAVAPRPALAPVLMAVAVVAIATPGLVGPQLERRTNTLVAAHATIPRDHVVELGDGVMARRDLIGDHPVLLSRHAPLFSGMDPALGYELTERGIDVRQPVYNRFYVAEARLVDRDDVDSAIVLVYNDLLREDAPPGGELVASTKLWPGLDVDSYRSLVEVARSTDTLDLGPAGEQAMADLPDEASRLLHRELLSGIVDDPADSLRHPGVLEWVRDNPLVEPALDPALAGSFLESLDGNVQRDLPGDTALLDVYVLDRAETLDFAYASEIGRSPA